MKKVLFISIGVLFGLGFIWSIFYFAEKAKPKELVYKTKKATIGNVVKDTRATGSVVPREEVEVKSRVSGIISELYIEAGEKVEKGQLLAKIKIIPDMVTLSNAQSRVKTANVNLENSKRVYDRQKALFDKDVIAQSELDNVELQYLNAKEELRAAKENLQIIEKGITESSSASSNTLVRATVAGTVLEVPVEIGKSVIESNTFNDGTTIASIADMNDLIFKGKVDEAEVGKIELGMPLKLTIGAIQGTEFDAVLEYIAPKGVEESGAIQFEIRAGLKPNDSIQIRAGYSANASVVLDEVKDVIVIEESLVQFEDESEEPYIEILKSEGVFEKQNIELGLSDGVKAHVLSGVDTTQEIKVQNLGK